MTTIIYHNIDPTIFTLAGLEVRYYGVAYALSLLLGIFLLSKKYTKFLTINTERADDLLLYLVMGIIIGGRLGYALFYKPEFFTSFELFMIQRGGMSFHGGVIGLVISVKLFANKNKFSFWQLIDHIALVAPIGLFFGRIANFINGELWGKHTDGSWGVIFPCAPDSLPRHPSQLYEAFGEGLILLIILNILYYKTNLMKQPGKMSGVFIAGYSIARILIEIFREPDAHLGKFMEFLSMGQILSIPMFFLGLFLLYKKDKKIA